MKVESRYIMALGAFFLFLAVMLGAFGAHGLEGKLSVKSMSTFTTGIRYHFYHGFGILIVSILKFHIPEIKLEKVALSFGLGILLFSFNCYLYAITGIKALAMIIPIGGVFFLVGWLLLCFYLVKGSK